MTVKGSADLRSRAGGNESRRFFHLFRCPQIQFG